MRTERYHGDGPLPLKELRALRVLAGRLREQAERAINGGFDAAVSEEIDRLAAVECDLLALIRERERGEASAA